MNEITLSVPEIHCDHCKTSIEGAVSTVAGVTAVTVDIEARTVRVSADSADAAPIVAAIEDQGYMVAP